MRPPNNIDVPFNLLFPLLVYYFAQLQDKEVGGEYSTDMSWENVCMTIDCSEAITLSRSQLESLLYSFKMGVVDRRRPFKILQYFAKNYAPLMKAFKQAHPDLFKEEIDGEILLTGEDYIEQR